MQVSFNFLSSFLNVLEFYSDILNGGIELRDRANCFQLQRQEGVLIVKEDIWYLLGQSSIPYWDLGAITFFEYTHPNVNALLIRTFTGLKIIDNEYNGMWREKNLENFVSSKWESAKPTTF